MHDNKGCGSSHGTLILPLSRGSLGPMNVKTLGLTFLMPKRIYNSITAMDFWQCLPFSWTTLRGKHCRHPIAVLGVVDTFGQ